MAFVETKNLDGETNLKTKICNRKMLDIFKTEEQVNQSDIKDYDSNLLFKISNSSVLLFEYDKPNMMIYNFKGAIVTKIIFLIGLF